MKNKLSKCPKCGRTEEPGYTYPIICPVCDWNNVEHEYEYILVDRERAKRKLQKQA